MRGRSSPLFLVAFAPKLADKVRAGGAVLSKIRTPHPHCLNCEPPSCRVVPNVCLHAASNDNETGMVRKTVESGNPQARDPSVAPLSNTRIHLFNHREA